MNRNAFRVVGLALALGAAGAAFGQARTPMGAEAGANAAGTIPAWTGGLVKPQPGHVAHGHYADPFKADKPLFTITGANADQYKVQLSPGQFAMLKKYPSWKMIVYPTRRSAAYPKAVYDETVANAGKAKLSPGGNGVVGVRGGIPFRPRRMGWRRSGTRCCATGETPTLPSGRRPRSRGKAATRRSRSTTNTTSTTAT